MRDFKDFVVKLVVLDSLWETEIDRPYEDGWAWLQETRGVDRIGADDLIYGEYFQKRIPEIEQWARDVDITDDQLASITSLYWDGGLDSFMFLAPSWDGEDELFDVATWADITPERFPNLESLTYQGELTDAVRQPLEAAGVQIDEF